MLKLTFYIFTYIQQMDCIYIALFWPIDHSKRFLLLVNIHSHIHTLKTGVSSSKATATGTPEKKIKSNREAHTIYIFAAIETSFSRDLEGKREISRKRKKKSLLIDLCFSEPH